METQAADPNITEIYADLIAEFLKINSERPVSPYLDSKALWAEMQRFKEPREIEKNFTPSRLESAIYGLKEILAYVNRYDTQTIKALIVLNEISLKRISGRSIHSLWARFGIASVVIGGIFSISKILPPLTLENFCPWGFNHDMLAWYAALLSPILKFLYSWIPVVFYTMLIACGIGIFKGYWDVGPQVLRAQHLADILKIALSLRE